MRIQSKTRRRYFGESKLTTGRTRENKKKRHIRQSEKESKLAQEGGEFTWHVAEAPVLIGCHYRRHHRGHRHQQQRQHLTGNKSSVTLKTLLSRQLDITKNLLEAQLKSKLVQPFSFSRNL